MTEGRLLKPLPIRDWQAYSRGQVEEVRLFDQLLTDLVAEIEDAPHAGPGRRPVPTSTLAWATIKKAHSGYSSRRNQGHILDAEQGGFIGQAPRYNAAMEFLNRDDAEAILRGLVRASARPLAGIEEKFAVDSTGFACGTYGTYRHTRYGETKKRQWVKLHASVGVRFNVIAEAVVTANEGDGTGDSPNFAPLVRATAEAFRVREVAADMAYSSRDNIRAVRDLGAEPLIPFKSHIATSNTGFPSPWAKAYHYFAFHQEEFYSRYHMRSNVETTFGAIKQTLGERLKSKKPLAQRNEVLCKVVAWNIRCVVRAMLEAGAEPAFSPTAAARLFGAGEG